MTRAIAPRTFSLHLLLVSVAAAQGAPRPASPDQAAAFDVAGAVVQELVLPDALTGPLSLELFVDGAMRTLFLAPYSLRGEDFHVLAQRVDGSFERVEPGPVATVRGFLVGEPESVFAGSLSEGSLTGILRTHAGGSLFGLQPLSLVDPAAPPALHLLHESSDTLALPYECGTPDLPDLIGRLVDAGGSAAEGGAGSQWTEISCDADVEFYDKNGSSVTKTMDDIELVINGVDSIYNSDFNIRYQIGTILVRTAEPDPYSTSQPSPLLDQFRLDWLTNHGDIKRDVAHFFTGKNIAGSTIGIAYINGICSASSGYGLSQSKFTTNLTSRIALTAHELGHNWSASHCNGTPSCNIMCSGLGGCSGGLTHFGPAASAEINLKKGQVACTTGPPPTSAPTLFSATPDTMAAVTAGLIQVSGTALEWVEQVTIGAQVYTSPGGFTTYGDDTLYVSGGGGVPGIGPQALVATNPLGSSNALTVTYAESFPPVLINEAFAITAVDYAWKMGGEVDDLWFLLVAVGDDSTFVLFGFPLLLNGILVGSGSLGSIGVANLALWMPPSAVGLGFFSQLATVDGATGTFRGASAVKPTFVLL